MQQTQNYKLNKPGMSDTFAVAPLNENMDKVDQALAALDGRVVQLENCRIVLGCYDGTGEQEEQIIHLGERPAAVLFSFYATHLGYIGLTVGEGALSAGGPLIMKIVDDGFWVTGKYNRSRTFFYMAFLGDWPTKGTPNPECTMK